VVRPWDRKAWFESSKRGHWRYVDAIGTPHLRPCLSEFKFVDASIAAFVDELKDKGLYESTLIRDPLPSMGQSPIDPLALHTPQKKNGNHAGHAASPKARLYSSL